MLKPGTMIGPVGAGGKKAAKAIAEYLKRDSN